jgi:streptogramin lyase
MTVARFVAVVAIAGFSAALPALPALPALQALSAHASHGNRPRVFYHPTYRATAPARTAARAGIAYAGSVVSLPAVINNPSQLAYDPVDGYAYVVDQSIERASLELLRVSPHGGTTFVTTIASEGINGMAYDAQTHRFYLTGSPAQFAGNQVIFRIAPGGAVSVLAGGGSSSSLDGRGAAAGFADPTGITVDSATGVLYVVDGALIRRVTPGGVVTTLPATLPQSQSQQPGAIAYDAKHDRLIVALTTLNELLSVAPGTGAVTPLAGQCLSLGTVATYGCDPLERDGPAAQAEFASPTGLAVDSATGTIYVADQGNNAIRRIDSSGNVTTLAGNGRPAEVDGAGLDAEFNQPSQIALDAAHGRLYTLDTFVNENDVDTGTLRTTTVTGVAPPPPATPITLFETATPDRRPLALDWRPTVPASTGLWYSEMNGAIARLAPSGISTELADPFYVSGYYSGPQDIVLGGDGSQWYYDPSTANNLVRHASGFKAFTVPGPPYGSLTDPVHTLALGPGGNVWFVIDGVLGYVSPAGATVSFGSIIDSTAASLAFASDQTLWVATGNSLAHFNRSGKLLATLAYAANYVTQGPDGNVWFTQSDAIGTIRPGGVLVVYPLTEPVAGCPLAETCSRGVGAIATGSDGALWFAETQTTPGIGRLSVDGALEEFPILAARSNPSDVSTGPDGNLWFVDFGAQKVGRVNLIGPARKARRI